MDQQRAVYLNILQGAHKKQERNMADYEIQPAPSGLKRLEALWLLQSWQKVN